eukprot:1662052-Prymnesium_polylepis.1
MRPEQLNDTSDEILFARIDAVIAARSAGSADQRPIPPLAPFITLKLLFRLHERVASADRLRAGRAAAQC